MSVYRVIINLFFDNLTDIQNFKTQVQSFYPKVRNVVNENSNVVVHICGHDEIPPQPCKDIIYSWTKT